MKSDQEIITAARTTLEIESKAILDLKERISSALPDLVRHLADSPGRVVVTGIGKSAIIAQKIVATLNSTGTAALFMHAADAIHGDLGMIQDSDSIICLSKSGNTPEIKVLVPLLKQRGNKLACIVGNTSSFLAQHADFILDSTVELEACPNNLAPTTSTTAQLAMGDALAVCLMRYRGFSDQDFAQHHPGGTLGKRLFLKVEDLLDEAQRPHVGPQAKMEDVVLQISAGRLGAAAVVENDTVLGVITDGDIRRMLGEHQQWTNIQAQTIMNETPKTIDASALVVQAFQLMEKHNITQLLVLEDKKYKGIVHLHDILKEGIY